MEASTRILYPGQELLAAQTFHTYGLGTTLLTVAYGNEQVAVEFVVSENPIDESTNRMWAQVVAVDRLQVHILNYRLMMPAQVLGPFELGTFAGRSLTIIVQVTDVKKTMCKYISYSLYLGTANG